MNAAGQFQDPRAQINVRDWPKNLAAEQGLLGGMMYGPNTYHDVETFLRPEHFFDPMHGRIYREMARRISGGGLVDVITMKDWFEADPDSASAGGLAYLTKMMVGSVGRQMSGYYGKAIFETALHREMIQICAQAIDEAYACERLPGDVAATASAGLDRIVEEASMLGGVRTSFTIGEATQSLIRKLTAARKGHKIQGIQTGFRSIDNVIRRLDPGGLYVLAARPGMGKTSLALQMALNVAEAGKGVLFISLEMNAEPLSSRNISARSGVPLSAILSEELTDRQMEDVCKASLEIDALPLTIEERSGLTVPMIAAKAREAHRKHGLGLIVVDHLHIVGMPPETTKMGATWAVGQVSNALKRLAKDMGIPVLALAQLNRGVEGRDDKRPNMSDLRQSGEIEQDAEAVLMLYRQEYYLGKRKPEQGGDESPQRFFDRTEEWQALMDKVAGDADLIVAKLRNGEPRDVKLKFDGARTAFMERPEL